jgi:hypothetical protein
MQWAVGKMAWFCTITIQYNTIFAHMSVIIEPPFKASLETSIQTRIEGD